MSYEVSCYHWILADDGSNKPLDEKFSDYDEFASYLLDYLNPQQLISLGINDADIKCLRRKGFSQKNVVDLDISSLDVIRQFHPITCGYSGDSRSKLYFMVGISWGEMKDSETKSEFLSRCTDKFASIGLLRGLDFLFYCI